MSRDPDDTCNGGPDTRDDDEIAYDLLNEAVALLTAINDDGDCVQCARTRWHDESCTIGEFLAKVDKHFSDT